MNLFLKKRYVLYSSIFVLLGVYINNRFFGRNTFISNHMFVDEIILFFVDTEFYFGLNFITMF